MKEDESANEENVQQDEVQAVCTLKRAVQKCSITKTIAGERRRQEVGVKDKQGVLKTEMQERLQRWIEHFSEILNRDDTVNPVEENEMEEPEEIGEIDLGSWRLQEVKDALRGTRPGKASGVDEVGPEL